MCLSLGGGAKVHALDALAWIAGSGERGHDSVMRGMEQRAERQHEKHALSSLLTCLETTVGANGTEERAAAMRVINTLSLAPRALHKRKGVRAVMGRLGLGDVLRAVKEYEPEGEAAAGAGQYEEGCERDAEEEGNVGDVAGLARLVEAQVRLNAFRV